MLQRLRKQCNRLDIAKKGDLRLLMTDTRSSGITLRLMTMNFHFNLILACELTL